jgi:hypothetical protein
MASWRRKRVLRLLATLLLLPGALYLMLRWFEHHQVYQPSAAWCADGTVLGRAWENVFFTTSDGVKLNAWFFPAEPDSPHGQWVILFCHGNGGNISHRLDAYSALLETGANVFGFDYRGYGASQGAPSEAGTYLDAQAACQWLRQRGFAATDIVAFGESLGGGVVSELARRETVAGIILQSTFTSIPDLGAELLPWLPVRWLARIKYDTLSKLPRLHFPVLVMHSRADTLIRFHHGQRLFAAAHEPKLFWELSGDHNQPLEADRAKFVAGVEKFLALLEKPPRCCSGAAAN